MSSAATGLYEVTPIGERWAIRWDGAPLLIVNDLSTAVDLVAGAQRALTRHKRPEEPASFAADGDDPLPEPP